MIYFSGFCFKDEQELFKEFLPDNDYTVAGFSYGAIEAVEYALSQEKRRIDRLILLSPAFFADKSNSFLKMQTIYFKKDPAKYIKNFLDNVIFPASINLKAYCKTGTVEELKALLHYEWSAKKMQTLVERGILIETYLGKKDKIINADAAGKFFKNFSQCYTFKDYGHLLGGDNG